MNTRHLIIIIVVAVIGVGVFSTFSALFPDVNSNSENIVNSAPESLPTNNKDFVFDFYSKVAEQNPESNLFFSPLGISMAFSLAYEGAEGETARQMQQAFDFEKDDKKRGEMVAELLERLDGKDLYKLQVANALWVKDGYKINQSYLDTATTYYNSTVDNVDFVTNDGVNKINGWVKQKTEGKIQDILPPDSTDDLTRMVITNAVYFKGKWALQFNQQKTTEELFWIDKDKSVEVMMMKQPADMFHYAETDDLQALEMYYVGGDISMLVLLPKDRDGINSLEKSLDMQKIDSINNMMERQPLTVHIPKFEFETEYGLVGLMKNLGIHDAFDKNNANFEGITDEQVYLEQAKHKAFVSVDEEGTEAAAVTALVVRATSGPPTPEHEFIADHPFVFVIQEKDTGEILFIGRLVNPLI